MSNCSSSCATKDHETFGECMRAKNLQVADVTAHKFNGMQNRELNEYVRAREAGLQPSGTSGRAVREAWKKTDILGRPFRADKE